jgi:hypothetical protein
MIAWQAVVLLPASVNPDFFRGLKLWSPSVSQLN